MRRFALASLVILVTALGSRHVHAQGAEVIDGVAAIVNNEVITISQVRELIGTRERAMREAYNGPDLADKIKEMRLAALKDLVDRQLIIQEFRKMQEKGANIPDHVVDDRVQSIIREEFGGDRAAFVRTLQAQGYTLTRFKEIEKDKIIVQALRQSKMTDSFVVSPNQIQAFYEKNRPAYSLPEQVKLRMIVLREGNSNDIISGANKEQVAEEIREKLDAYYSSNAGASGSDALEGVGYIIGPRIASIMCAGGVLSYLLLIPLIKFFGDAIPGALAPGTIPIADMGPNQVRGAYILYIGAGAVAAWACGAVASKSAFTIRPLGPLPCMPVRSMPFCSAMRLASGEAMTRSLVAGLGAGCGAGVAAGAATGAVAALAGAAAAGRE